MVRNDILLSSGAVLASLDMVSSMGRKLMIGSILSSQT